MKIGYQYVIYSEEVEQDTAVFQGVYETTIFIKKNYSICSNFHKITFSGNLNLRCNNNLNQTI